MRMKICVFGALMGVATAWAGCDGAGTSEVCEPLSVFCGEGATEVVQCNADGSGTRIVSTCDAPTSCVVVGDKAECRDASAACEPGQVACAQDGSAIVECKTTGDGTFVQQPCGAASSCQVVDGAPTCVAAGGSLCQPGERACADDAGSVLQCSADGTAWETSSSCADGTSCVVTDGAPACEAEGPGPSCTPGETKCADDGASVLQCSADGSAWETSSDCTDGTSCVVTDGAPACEAEGPGPSCTPGETKCADDGASVLQCSADGSAWETSSDCTDGTSCVVTDGAPACEAEGPGPSCTPGETKCGPDGGSVVGCAPDGLAWDTVVTCLAGETCADGAEGPACTGTAPVCTAGELTCSTDGTQVLECKADGSGTAVKATCTGLQICVEDGGTASCETDPATQVCTPGAKECSTDGTQVLQCKGDGTGTAVTTTCVSPKICVAAAGTASCETDPATQVCTPGAKECSTDGTQVLQCKGDGTGTAVTTTCVSPKICVAAAGTASCETDPATQVCTPGAKECAEDGKHVLLCKPDGTGTNTVQTCTSTQQCISAGGTTSCQVPKICTPNERSCSADGKKVVQCKTDGTATFDYATCAAGQICVADGGTASCQVDATVVCTAGKTWCSADKAEIRLCDGTGKQWTLVEACQGGAQCTTDNVSFFCACAPKASKGCLAGDVVWLDSCGTATLDVACNPGAPCNDSGPTPVCGACTPAVSVECGVDPSGAPSVMSVNSCGVEDGVVESCAAGLFCVEHEAGPACTSSVADPDSPYYTDSCQLTQYISQPTSLIADCRCLENRALTGGLPLCWRPFEAYQAGYAWGAGVRAADHPGAHIYGGFLDADLGAIFAVVDWSSASYPNEGYVEAVDITTGDRSVVSGRYLKDGAAVEVGTGHPLSDVVDVQRGPDGQLYVWSGTNVSGEIVRVDPVTGERTLVWQRDGAGFAVCDNGRDGKSVQTRADGFAIDASGAFLLGFANTSPFGEGLGVIRIAGTGAEQTCTTVSRSGTMSENAWFGQPIGGGWDFTSGWLAGFELHEGKLLAVNAFDLTLYSVDLTTGDRARITSASSATPLGDGPTGASGVGLRWVRWDATRQQVWTVGRQGETQIVLVDPADGTRTSLSCSGPTGVPGLACISGALATGLSQGFGGFWFDPDDSDLVVFSHDSFGVVLLEVSTGNSLILSL